MATDQRPKQARLTLGHEDHGRLLSAEEFALASYAEPWNYEREEGRLVVMAPDGEKHDNASEPWRDLLGAYKLSRPDRVHRVVSEAWVRVSQGTDRIGDIGVYLVSDQQVQPIPDRVPDLMFDFVSPGREARERDYIKKREDYYRI